MVNVFLGVYVLGLAPALLLAGTLSDRLGRRPVMLVGITASVAGSALLAAGAHSVPLLTAGRLLSSMTVGIAMAVGNTWLKELSQHPLEDTTDGAGARRAALAFTLGSASGALVAGCLAQWAPAPEVLPYLVHIALAVSFLVFLGQTPETSSRRTAPGWLSSKVGTAAAQHPRFRHVVLLTAPWIFASAALAYGWMPTQLAHTTGQWGLVFATTATVVTLGVSSAVQPLARRLHSISLTGALVVALTFMTGGLAVVLLAVALQSWWTGLLATAVVGAGMGIALVSSLLEIQHLSAPSSLAGLTGVFYAAAYTGFTVPALLSAVASSTGIPATAILALLLLVGLGTVAALLMASRRHPPGL